MSTNLKANVKKLSMDGSFNLNRTNYRLIVERKGNIFFHAHASELNFGGLKGAISRGYCSGFMSILC